IVGENGSGKSTLVKLLMRFYNPTIGAISIDNDNLKDFNIFDLHKNLSATFQDFSRFKLTLKENVITGYSFNEERVNNFLKRSEEHTSELQSRFDLVCRLLLEKKITL